MIVQNVSGRDDGVTDISFTLPNDRPATAHARARGGAATRSASAS